MNYYDVLGFIHAQLSPRTYLEIGVQHGRSLRLARAGTCSIGVDPQLEIEADIRHLNMRLYKVTSDEFFAHNSVVDLFGGRLVDLAFIDGMHTFDCVLRDFANIEKSCGESSVILIHDSLPIDEKTALRSRSTVKWSGDVWKAIVCLRKYRPDLRISTLEVAPTGLSIVTNLNRHSTIISDDFTDLVEEFRRLDYGYLHQHKREELAVQPCRPSIVGSLLPCPFSPSTVVERTVAATGLAAKWMVESALMLRSLRPIYWKLRGAI